VAAQEGRKSEVEGVRRGNLSVSREGGGSLHADYRQLKGKEGTMTGNDEVVERSGGKDWARQRNKKLSPKKEINRPGKKKREVPLKGERGKT